MIKLPSGIQIKNIQTGTLTIASSAATGTATISNVDTSKSICYLLGFKTVDGYIVAIPNIILTNGTTVTGYRGGNPAQTTIIKFVVIEFANGIKSIQNVSKSGVNSTAQTSTISSVDTTKAAVFPQGFCATGSSTMFSISDFPFIELTNSTTLTFLTANAAGNLNVYATVAEFL